MSEAQALTDAEIGRAIRWLATIPLDASIRIVLRCDEGCMEFGAAHRAMAGWCFLAEGQTLEEQLRWLLGRRAEIDRWVEENRNSPAGVDG